ncbi:MAG: tRNA dihydrouridine synthase DusB [Trueperella sp.]|nr:tRNA dihydrouridine synthase DusB [Trueperella sp.]
MLALSAVATVQLGEVKLGTPIMLAPMAGVTNPPFRQLCREFAEQALAELPGPAVAPVRGTLAPAGLYVCEMITSRALLERIPETMNMIQPDPGDPVRSIQLYGVEPANIYQAAKLLAAQGWADHIDLNFGCPVPKVTRKGGGAALPWKQDLFSQIVQAAVRGAAEGSESRDHLVPVTAKLRIGIDADHETFLTAAELCAAAGISGLTLHGRTLTQHYSGTADWDRIAQLKSASELPVFGNGDVFEADDAERMMAQTQCDGVVVGRGCQGRPWLFYDLVASAHGSSARMRPSLRQVAQIVMRHAELSVEHFGSEERALREMRKHVGWYMRGFEVGGKIRGQLHLVSELAQLESLLNSLDLDQPFPQAAIGKRGRAGGEKRAHLPEGWLDSPQLTAAQQQRIHEAELADSGG